MSDRCRGWMLAAAALLIQTSTALGQTPVKAADESSGMLDWVVAVGLAAIACAAGFMNPKRSHQN